MKIIKYLKGVTSAALMLEHSMQRVSTVSYYFLSCSSLENQHCISNVNFSSFSFYVFSSSVNGIPATCSGGFCRSTLMKRMWISQAQVKLIWPKFLAALAALYLGQYRHFRISAQRVTFETWDPSDIRSAQYLEKKTNKDKETKIQKDKRQGT